MPNRMHAFNADWLLVNAQWQFVLNNLNKKRKQKMFSNTLSC